MKTSLFIGLILMIFIPTVYGQSTIPEKELLGQGSPTLVEKDGYRLRPEAAQAFDAMKIAALKDGIDIKVVSSYRDYAHQNRIWERKYLRFRESGLTPMQAIEKIIEYSTIPGTSRHHWATDLDLIDGTPKVDGDVLVPSKFHGTGPFCKFKDWMDIHANTFGFQLVYTDEINRKGFKYEPWHYSYAALSKSYLQAYNALDIQQMLAAAKLMGSENFTDEFIVRYLKENVNDVNPSLLD
jgi:LAS superfamily LD-carboxypeptidase LdcB